MTNSFDNAGTPSATNVEASRDLLGDTLSEAERSAALRAGRTPIPPRFILIVSLVLAAITIVGSLLEHFLGNVGQPSRLATHHVTSTSSTGLSTTPTVPQGRQLGASVQDLLGLHQIASATAPDFTLSDQSKNPWQLSAQRGSVVVLTFFDARCQDICPVLGREVAEARTILHDHRNRVTFAIVNTNPNATSPVAHPAALQQFGLATMPNVHFLNGPLNRLNQVWVNYGVQIRVNREGRIAHNEVMYFITPLGKLKELAVPFADQSKTGGYTLRSAQIHNFASGVAQTASKLEQP